jgi:hypothetical protein
MEISDLHEELMEISDLHEELMEISDLHEELMEISIQALIFCCCFALAFNPPIKDT